MKSQVHQLKTLGYDGVVDNAVGRRVVGLDGQRTLEPAHVNESLTERHDGADSLKKCTEFGL